MRPCRTRANFARCQGPDREQLGQLARQGNHHTFPGRPGRGRAVAQCGRGRGAPAVGSEQSPRVGPGGAAAVHRTRRRPPGPAGIRPGPAAGPGGPRTGAARSHRELPGARGAPHHATAAAAAREAAAAVVAAAA